MSGSTDGSSRSARVQAADFVDGLDAQPVDEVRRRRDEALAEREFLSYLRRLVQVRRDFLAAEQSRRRGGGDPGPLLDRLTEALAEGPQGGSRGEALRTGLPEPDLGEAERRLQSLIGDLSIADPQEIDDEGLERALRLLDRAERGISADRTAVLRVHDRLQEELKRRYREDPSAIPRKP